MRTRLAQESGAIAIVVALVFVPILMGGAALGIEVSRWFAILERVQRAADAAALAAAPQWTSARADAVAAAREAVRRNGYLLTGSTRLDLVSGSAAGTVRATLTVSVSNPLGAALGEPARELTRMSEAGYSAPISMGSSCNVVGDEPDPASGDLTDPADGTGSVASSLCAYGRRPHLWASIAGPDTSKVTGDRFASRWCTNGNSGCRANNNLDYRGYGSAATGATDGQPSYFLRVTVRRPVPSMTVQLFDPAFVDVGDACDRMPKRSATDPSWPGLATPNPYVRDAARRYAFGSRTTTPASSGEYCTGDTTSVAVATPAAALRAPVVTSFALHAPTNSGDPWRAPVLPTCVRQYPGWILTPLAMTAALTTPGDPALQRYFRQWVTVCTVIAPQVGDYYLQVRTNIGAGRASSMRMTDPREDADATGTGLNRFSVRVNTPGDQEAVSVAGVERLGLYVNVPAGRTTFLLARVGSAAAGSTLRVELFDLGDAQAPAILALLRPPLAAGTWPARCMALGEPRGSPLAPADLPNCELTGVSSASGFNGKIQHVAIELPADYRCVDNDPTDCWFRIAVDYPSSVFDTTTWTASLEGDPVRLIQ